MPLVLANALGGTKLGGMVIDRMAKDFDLQVLALCAEADWSTTAGVAILANRHVLEVERSVSILAKRGWIEAYPLGSTTFIQMTARGQRRVAMLKSP